MLTKDVPLVSVLALVKRGEAGQRAEKGLESREPEGERVQSVQRVQSQRPSACSLHDRVSGNFLNPTL